VLLLYLDFSWSSAISRTSRVDIAVAKNRARLILAELSPLTRF